MIINAGARNHKIFREKRRPEAFLGSPPTLAKCLVTDSAGEGWPVRIPDLHEAWYSQETRKVGREARNGVPLSYGEPHTLGFRDASFRLSLNLTAKCKPTLEFKY